MLTILMYHYVRDLPRTRFPRISGMPTQNFIGQLDYIQNYYTVCSARQVIAALHQKERLPKNACLLTFDDGYLDHFTTVFPILKSRGLAGNFYAPASAVEDRKVLQINKIHFVLASTEDHGQVRRQLFDSLKQFRNEYQIPEDEQLYEKYSKMSRWDSPDTAFVKKVLQNGLPEEVGRSLADDLFASFVEESEAVLAEELYMNMFQLQTLVSSGMEVGGHGFSHRALENLPRVAQMEEIERTAGFLRTVYGGEITDWTLTYPSGSYTEDTIELLEEAGCALAMTTQVGLADISEPLKLRRLNANDLPISGEAQPNKWTKQVID